MSTEKTMQISIEIECQECNGEGGYEMGPDCWQPASNCCGGCYTSVPCESCSSGKIMLTFDEEEIETILNSLINEGGISQEELDEIIKDKI